MSTGLPIYRADIPSGMYLGRDARVNPRVFLQWGQETAEVLRLADFSDYGQFEISSSRTIFMRNLRLELTEALYTTAWTTAPYTLSVEAFNSHTGRTSFDLTLRWLVDGELVATLVRKMVYMSLKTGKPTPLPELFVSRNPAKSDLQFSLCQEAPRSAAQANVHVRPSDIDFNNHVGHPTYVDYMLDSACVSKYQYASSDLLAERISCIDLEYKYPVVLGRRVTVQSWDGEGEGGVEVNFVMHQAGTWLGSTLVALGRVQLFSNS